MVVFYANGEWVEETTPVIPVDERGHQFGDGIYEVVRVYDGVPFMLKEHIDRLFMSAQAIQINMPWTKEEITSLMEEGVTRANENNCAIYLQVTRGIALRHHLFPQNVQPSITMTVRPVTMTPIEERKKGKRAIFLPDERWANCYIKSLNLLPNILAKQEAVNRGADEAIFIRDSYMTEGTASNTYIVQDGAIVTTPISKRILYGITRMRVEQIAAALHLPFVERHVTKEEVLAADEVFYTSSTIEIMPIVEIEGKQIGNGQMGPVVTRLFDSFFEQL